MHSKFASLVESLEPSLQKLMTMPAVRYESLPRMMPASGIYLFSEGGQHLYVGRTRRIRRRLADHCRTSSRQNVAAFAFLLARRETGKVKASYTTTDSRVSLSTDPVFTAAFEAAKARIRQMEIRFVEEPEPLRQALLEMYAAVALDTKYNDFDTH